MRLYIVVATLLLSACDQSLNSFEVLAPGADKVELQLCGVTTIVRQQRDRFTATRRITCEGHGEITVRYADRSNIICPIGYITPGLRQSYRFEIQGDQCLLIDV